MKQIETKNKNQIKTKNKNQIETKDETEMKINLNAKLSQPRNISCSIYIFSYLYVLINVKLCMWLISKLSTHTTVKSRRFAESSHVRTSPSIQPVTSYLIPHNPIQENSIPDILGLWCWSHWITVDPRELQTYHNHLPCLTMMQTDPGNSIYQSLP